MSKESRDYESKYRVRLIDSLGDGKDGCVFLTEHGRAVKFVYDSSTYRRELRA
jgi:hypothetical protein